ncbi:50S ribosomal protein L20 [Shimia sp. R9_3]|uniref:50S ribosomal protein L20 n=1 Tax=Shimia sp. R9_3 TaxID=2821113 RepID=UPI001AD9C537|nr:50S ribosomal protein L20 [Shimia sp. R9_3]MBO9401397.1 50S ribosomal protein L20 [Shimia sp. R9_3]
MKFHVALVLGAAVLVGCGSGSSSKEVSGVAEADIERCWKQAGVKGDLYRYITPQQAVGVVPGGVFSEQQAAAFKSCLGV